MRTATLRRGFLPAWCVAASALACAAVARGGEAPGYSLTLIDSGQADAYVIPRGVNDRGEIAGTLSLDAGGRRPVLWTPAAGMTRLGDFIGNPAADGLAIGINNAGQVVGTVFNRAAFWPSADKAVAVAPEPSTAIGVNDAGVVVGGTTSPTGTDGRAFRQLADGTLQYLSAPGLGETGAAAVNASGHVAGLSSTGPFVWAPDGTVTTLTGLFGGSRFGTVPVINNDNWVVSSQFVGGGDDTRAVLWRPGEDPLDLGGLPGWTTSVAESINNAGAVAGFSIVGGQARAFVWTDGGGAVSLTDRLDATGRGWALTHAFDINDRGQIVGQGIYQGRLQGFLLTPVPEPAGAFIIAAGAAALALRRRRGLRGRETSTPPYRVQ